MQGFNEKGASQGLANADLKKVSVSLAALSWFMITSKTNYWGKLFQTSQAARKEQPIAGTEVLTPKSSLYPVRSLRERPMDCRTYEQPSMD